MITQLAVIAWLLSRLQGRELSSPSQSLHLDPASPVEGDGSLVSPFRSLDSALDAALTYASVSLRIIPSPQIAFSTKPYVVASDLTIIGNGATLRLQGELNVHAGGNLILSNLTLSTGPMTSSPMFESQGLLSFLSVTGEKIPSFAVVVTDGELTVTDSYFLKGGSFASVKNSAAVVVLSHSQFEEVTGDLVRIAPESSDFLGGIELASLVISFISGHVIDYQVAPATDFPVRISNCTLVNSTGGLLSGIVARSKISIRDSLFRNVTEVFNTHLDDSVITFEKCVFSFIHTRLFGSVPFSGLISVSYSSFSDIPQGPIFYVIGNSPSTSIVSLSHCLLTRIANPDSMRTSILAFAISTSVVVSDVEVWKCTAFSNGLFTVTNGVGLVSDLYYHDSSVVVSSFMTFVFSTLEVENVRMERVENQGGAVMANMLATGGHWFNVSITDSLDSTADPVNDFIILWVGYFVEFTVRDCYFRNPGFAPLSMAATDFARIYIQNTVFADNTMVRFFDVFLDGTFIMQNVTLLRSSVQFLINCVQSVFCFNVSNLHIQDPRGIGYIGFLDLSNGILSNTTLTSISADLFHINSGGITLQNIRLDNFTGAVIRQSIEGIVSILGLSIENSKNAFLFKMSNSVGNFSGLKVRNGSVRQIFLLERVNGLLLNSEFSDIVVDAYGGFATLQGNTQMTIQSCKLVNVNGKMSISYGLIYTENSQLTIITSSVSHFNATLIHAHQSTLTLYNSQFTDGGFNNPSVYLGKTYGAVLNDHDSYLVTVTACTFTNLAAQFGGAIAHIREKIDVGMLFYAGNLMKNCSAQYGGALYVTKSSLSITTSNFTGNKADYGGALWANGESGKSVLKVQDSNFVRNIARLEGGAIQHFSCSLLSKGLEFRSNSALYGPNIAMQLSYITIINQQNLTPIINATVEGVSGQTLTNSLKLGLFDALNQLIVTDNSSLLYLHAEGADRKIEGNVLLYPTMGIYEADNLIITGSSQTIVNVSATVASISSPVFGVYLRACVVGEQLEDSKCTVCSNNMYSFHPSVPCTLCPREAVCTEGFKLTLLPGYWRSSVYTDSIYSCIVSELCLGGYESQCMEGHTGPMCNACKEDYFKANQLQCIACKGPVTSTFKSFFTLTVSLVSVVASVRDKHNFQMIHSAVFNYFNTLRILANLNIYWPDSLAYLLTVLGDIGSLGLTAFSDLCLGSISTIASIYSQIFVSVIYFISIGIMTAIISSAVLWIRTGSLKYSKIGKLVFFTCYQMLPTLFMRMTQLLSCYEVDSVQRLIYDASEECWSPRHRRYALGVALPIMLVFVSIPCGLLAASCGKRHRPHFSVIQMAVYLLFNFALSGVLILSNALRLPSQVGLVVLISIVTELFLNTTLGYRTQPFGYIHQTSQTAATLLTLAAAIYASSDSSSSRQSTFIAISYLILLSPLFALAMNTLRLRYMRKKFRTLPMPVRDNRVEPNQDSSYVSCKALVGPSASPASVSANQSLVLSPQ